MPSPDPQRGEEEGDALFKTADEALHEEGGKGCGEDGTETQCPPDLPQGGDEEVRVQEISVSQDLY